LSQDPILAKRYILTSRIWKQVKTKFGRIGFGTSINDWYIDDSVKFGLIFSKRPIQMKKKIFFMFLWPPTQGTAEHRGQFHQDFRSSFYVHMSQKCKKRLTTLLYYLHFWDLLEQKLLIKCWWNWLQVWRARFVSHDVTTKPSKNRFVKNVTHIVKTLYIKMSQPLTNLFKI